MARLILAILLAISPSVIVAQDKDYDALVTEIAQGELEEWITDPVILFAILEQNEAHAAMTELRIAGLDKRWRDEDGAGPMIWDLLDRQASVLMRDRRELAGGVITEIIVMDAYGLNVAISDPTSDYYQGDEAKYQETYLVGPGAVHVGDLEFDESTQKTQVQVSKTVLDPDSGAPIGAVTFGIDLDAIPAR